MKLNPLGVGLVLGLVIGLWHAAWAGLVALGYAQPLIDFIFRLHFLSQPFQLQPFDPAIAATLVGVTAGIGFVMGLIFALVWNLLFHPKLDLKS